MQPRLICLDGIHQGEVTLMEGGALSLGRGAGNTLVLTDAAISRNHCTLRQSDSGELEIVDHDSR